MDEKKILVVDDDDAIRMLLLTVLRRRGYRVDAARNGAEALEKMAGARHALVVLDLMMPRMSGYELLDHLEKQSSKPRVLILTAGQEPKVPPTDFVIGTIHKPFDIALLLDIVAGCLATTEGVGPPTSAASDGAETIPN